MDALRSYRAGVGHSDLAKGGAAQKLDYLGLT
jgi:hypothetical protein